MLKKVRLGTVFLLALLFGIAMSSQASAQSPACPDPSLEDLGNFPDAIEVCAEFTTVNINGTDVSGFLFHLTNSSYGNGQHSSFDNDPDGHFAEDDVLTTTAGNAIANAQPFGIYSFGALLPDGSGAFTTAPAGFAVDFDDLDDGMQEINFTIDLDYPSGLIFDESAAAIAGKIDTSIFTNPRVGTFDFFISTPDGFTPDQLPQVRNDPGIDVSTRMAWEEDDEVQTKIDFNGRRLRPRGELGIIEQGPGGGLPPPA